MKILFTEEQIQKRITELGKEIADYYRGKPLTLITIMNGSIMLSAAVAQKIDYSVWLDSIAASSYKEDKCSGELNIRSTLKLPVKGRHVLLLDDIFDTGFTLSKIHEYMMTQGALSVRTCVLLNKVTKKKLFRTPEWVGFNTPDHFVVGFGMDYNEDYRNLPYIAVLD